MAQQWFAAGSGVQGSSQRFSGALSPCCGDAPVSRRRRLSVQSANSVERGQVVKPTNNTRQASISSAAVDASQRSGCLQESIAAEQPAGASGLYKLTGELLWGSYAFIFFHVILLQFYPEFFTFLRYPPSFGHPLMLLPLQKSLFGWFFSYVNGSIQQFVMRGVFGSIALVCLLHFVRVVLRPTASLEGGHTTVENIGCIGTTEYPNKMVGALRHFFRTSWAAQRRFHRRRERLCARVIAAICLGLTVIQTSSFFFGGWTLKAIGFPDIYLGALTKPGQLWGHETTTDIMLQHSDISLLPEEQLKEILGEIEETRNQPLIVFVLVLGFALDTWGQYLQVQAIRRYLSKKMIFCEVVVLASVISFASFNLQRTPSCNAHDHHWVDFGMQRDLGHMTEPDSSFLVENPPLMYSEYLPMRDGVRLAADIYLPHSFEGDARSWAQLQHKVHVLRKSTDAAKKRLDFVSAQTKSGSGEVNRLSALLVSLENIIRRLRDQEKVFREQFKGIPVYLEITRYNRRSEHFWPFTLLSIWRHPRGSSVNIWSWQTQQVLSANQYAVVVIDTRGSGASFGSRSVDLGEEELEDAAELVAWSKHQWFSNGKVAGGGLSYDGMLGLSMAAMGGVDAVISLFTPMDVLGELVAPGGMICHSFLKDYTSLTTNFEYHGTPWRHMLRSPLQFPFHVLLGFIFSFGGISAVLGHEAELPHALRSHRPNWKMTDAVSAIRYYDDKVKLSDRFEAAATSFGITEKIMEGLAQKNVNILMVSGFCDSATARGAVRLFSYMQEHAPKSRPQLILGNWNHGGRRSCDPYGGSFSCFEVDLYSTVLRFFDCRLKNNCWGGIDQEPPVHFWQTGSAEWRTAHRFPPEHGMKHVDIHLTNQQIRNASAFAMEDDSAKGVKANISGNSGRLPTKLWAPQMLFPNTSSFEHILHDISQRIQLYWNLLELQGEKYNVEPTENNCVPEGCGTSHKKSKRTSLSKFLSAFMAATVSSQNSKNSGNFNMKLFRQDKNAYLMLFPSAGRPNEIAEGEAQVGTYIDYAVEYLSSSGEYSRWTIAQHPFRLSVNYSNRLFQRKKRPDFTLTLNPENDDTQPFSLSPYTIDFLEAQPLSFLTEPLSETLEMIGSAFLNLRIAVRDCNEVNVFAYIEDLEVSSGYSHYVTEGHVVASNRPSKILDDLPVGAYGRVVRSFRRQDNRPVDERGEEVIVSLNFEPNAWTFKKGHAIRLVLTGSDIDNFSPSSGSDITLPRYWRVVPSDALLSLPIFNDGAIVMQ